MRTTESTMDLTIVIVNWNGGQLLMRCLESIRAHAGSAEIAVIVIDNASSDGSREAATAAFPEFQIRNSGANLGFGRANNLARTLIGTPVVLFLNPDTELLDGALDRALDCLKHHPDVGALGCKMLTPDGETQALGLQWHMAPWTALVELLLVARGGPRFLRRCLPIVDPERSGYVTKLYGGFLMVRREVLDSAGWFDERYFMYAEDADLSRTIISLGWKLYYCAEAAIMHVCGGATAKVATGFHPLMKQESINKLIAKYQGGAAALLHRAVVFFAGSLRLTAATLASWITAFERSGIRTSTWKARSRREAQLVLWALGLEKASVPEWRSSKRAA